MQNDMQTVHVKRGARIVHIETELGIVNIYVGLRDRLGRRVENVRMSPGRYVGTPKIVVRGSRFVELKTKRF